MKFPNNLKRVRESIGMTMESYGHEAITQEKLAHGVGCSRMTIWKIENGESEPSVGLAMKICRALGADPSKVFPVGKEVQNLFRSAKRRSPDAFTE